MSQYEEELAQLNAEASADTDKVKALLKEIALLSGTIKNLQARFESERELRAELENRLAVLEAERDAENENE